MSPLNPDLGKTGKKDMASLCGRQAFSVVVVVLFVCAQNVRDKAGQKQKGGQMSL